MLKTFLVILSLLFIFTTSEAEDLLKVDEAGLLQANLQNVSLQEVTSFFEEKYGIKFIGDSDLLQTQVTTSFARLSPEKALKKIFAKMNFSLRFNSQGRITEVHLLPTSENKTRPAMANNPKKREKQQLPVDVAVDPSEPNIVGDNEVLNIEQEQTNAQTTDEAAAFQVVPNAPLPGDAIEADSNDEIRSFQVVPNTPPSGDAFQIVPSAPPSGN